MRLITVIATVFTLSLFPLASAEVIAAPTKQISLEEAEELGVKIKAIDLDYISINL
jgi:hypothetical protein